MTCPCLVATTHVCTSAFFTPLWGTRDSNVVVCQRCDERRALTLNNFLFRQNSYRPLSDARQPASKWVTFRRSKFPLRAGPLSAEKLKDEKRTKIKFQIHITTTAERTP